MGFNEIIVGDVKSRMKEDIENVVRSAALLECMRIQTCLFVTHCASTRGVICSQNPHWVMMFHSTALSW